MLAPARRQVASIVHGPTAESRLSPIVAGLLSFLAPMGTILEPLVLPGLTLMACLIRASALPAIQGTLSRDESRLALAARGILEHGIPILPGGVLYTRGILPAYVEAGVFAVTGVSDQSARLLALILGTMLVPATYLLANALMGRWPALAAATIVAFSPPLVFHSRQGWLYPWLSVGFVLALWALLRWYQQPQIRFRIYAALAFAMAIFSHELAAVFVPIAAVADLWLVWRRRTQLPWRQLIGFWSVVLACTAAGIGLNFVVRTVTAGGALAEVNDHLRPLRDPRGLVLTLRVVSSSQPWLVPAAALGLVALALRGTRGLRASAWLLFLAIVVQLSFNGFVLTRRGMSRDVQVLVPLMAVAATYSLWRWGPHLVRALSGWPSSRRGAAILATALLAGLTISSVDLDRVSDGERDRTRSWLQTIPPRGPNDLVMTFAPTVAAHYLGRVDFWVRPTAYLKYVWAGRPPYRDIQSGATVIRNAGELQSLVLDRYPGHTLWLILQRNFGEDIETVIAGMLARYPVEDRTIRDGPRVLRVQL